MSARLIRLLYIEDDPDDVILLKTSLAESSAASLHLTCVGRLDTGLACLAEGGMDVILLDLNLPDSQGLDTLKTLIPHAPCAPVLVMSGLADEALALKAVQQGAQDYLVKGRDDGQTIVRIVYYAIERHQLARALRLSETRTRTIIEQNLDGILIVDYAGVMRFVNPAAAALFGRPAEQLVGDAFGFPTAADGTSELEILRPGSSIRIVEMRSTEFAWEAQPARLVSLHDITDRKRAEIQLQAKTAALVAEVAEREQLQAELKALSLHDELTGLYNRRGFMLLADQLWRLARRNQQDFVILYMDVDRFKHINDTYGHAQGDQALRDVARILLLSSRESDIQGRLGGDEFAALLVDCNLASAQLAITRLKENLNQVSAYTSGLYTLALSIGVAHFDPSDQADLHALMAQADADMYLQKQRSHASQSVP
jgi:diguanylate cyclase (GGDEF)-like protein